MPRPRKHANSAPDGRKEMNMDIDTLLAEVERLDGEATPGPWRTQGASIRVDLPSGIEFQWGTAAYPRDNNLIVTYRTAAPALAAEVRRLRAELDPQDENDPRLRARVFGDAQPGSTFAEIRHRYAARYADVPAEQVFKDVDELLYALGEAQAGFSGVLKLMRKRKAAMEELKAEAERLRAAVVFADEQGAEAIDRVSKRLIADKWNSTAAFQQRALAAEAKLKQIAADNTTLLVEQRGAEIVNLSTKLRERNAVQVRTLAFLKGLLAFPDAEQVPDPELPEEMREVLVGIKDLVQEQHLTLAAEQGRQEGAPSPGWEYGVIDEDGGFGWRKKTADGMIFAWGRGILLGINGGPDEPHPGGWNRWVEDEDGDLDDQIEHVTDETWGSRAAMLAADAAVKP